MVLAAGDLVDRHALEGCHHLSWLSDSIPIGVAQAKLTLISITAPEDFVLICDKDRVSATSFQVFHALVVEGLLGDGFGSKYVFQTALFIWSHAKSAIESLTPSIYLAIVAQGESMRCAAAHFSNVTEAID